MKEIPEGLVKPDNITEEAYKLETICSHLLTHRYNKAV